MGNLRGFGVHLFFVSVFLVATTCTCLGVRNTSVVCYEKERLALLKFKNSVKDPSGMMSSWVGIDCCRWEGIRCDIVTGEVESLHLRGDDYVGDSRYLVGNEVNSCLAELRHLKYLDLSGNDFHGSRIPEFIGSLKHLTYLNLSRSFFQGIIPHHIGNLSNLKVLDLSSNGGLMADDMTWAFDLSSLKHLDLSFVDLSGAHNRDMVLYMIPLLEELSLQRCGLSNVDLGPYLNSSRILPNIKHLDLSFNSFKCPHLGFFQNMTSLAFLDLSGFEVCFTWNFANLLDMIPSLSELHLSDCGIKKSFLSPSHLNFTTLSSIQHLDLSRNSIQGIFPSVLTNLSFLRVLDLSYNSLSSSVPNMPNLYELDLSSNEFKQMEHVGILRHCHLKKLSASNNHFDREMIDSPKNVSECSQYSLERLDLHWSLNGTIPESLERMENLREIDLSNNRITGPIPESLRRLIFLKVLDLSYNLLTGPIPTFLGKLTALTDLYLRSNKLTGPIPVSIKQLSKLRSLDISNNYFEGVVSEAHFANLSMLKHLDTSFNTKVVFNVSREWIPPFQLVILDLTSCKISNGFPEWLRNQRKLDMLLLSNATISGPLPTWLRKIPIIPFLVLSHNKLIGPLTNLPSRGNVYVLAHGLSRLILQNNLFNGSIPRSLCKRTNLVYLNLSQNRLTGKIPKCIENLQKLLIMRFSSNQLSGVIPRSIAHCSSLIGLNLNDNNLIGELPRELGNLRDLNVLDLGENKLSGYIPEWIGEELTSLMFLRLHGNNFTGRIPRSLCKSSNLQILDIAFNNLTGAIPGCLGELNAMVTGSPSQESWHLTTLDLDEIMNQFLKGVDLEYTRTLDMVFNMDLSSNKLVGEIPVELTTLSMLVGLNLSNNHLIGGIPYNIGNMTSLFSLDLSRNELTGVIPPSMASLTFLSHLNLSHNNLSGRIPIGNQLQTLTDPSIYAGNKYLCGPPLPMDCSNHKDPTTTTTTRPKKKSDDQKELWLFGLDIMSGFASGFWGVIGVLLFKKQWRHKIFMFVEETIEKIHVAFLVRVANVKRGREAT